MDPLSVAASVIACLQAANSVISVCLDYRAALKSAPWGLTEALNEMRSLRSVLETVESLANNAHTNEANINSTNKQQWTSLQQLCSEHGPLQACTAELDQLEKKLHAPKWAQNVGKKRRALIQAIGWQVKDSDVRHSLEAIQRYKATVTLTLTTNEIALLADIQALSLSMQTEVHGIRGDIASFIQEQEYTKLDERHKAILGWLSTARHDATQLEVLRTTEGGSHWVFSSKEFLAWRNGAAGTPILWLSGIPGAGKTVLSGMIIRYLLQKTEPQAKNERIAYFFCDFRTPTCQESRDVIGALVAQLCTQSGWFPPQVVDSFNQSINSVGKNIPPELTLLKSALNELAQHSAIVLLIDALDECQASAEIIGVLNEITENANIKVFVASRDESHIRDSLLKCIRIRLETRSIEMLDDIKHYIRNRVGSEPKLQWLNLKVREYIETTLSSKSGGMFRWVQCQIDQISPLRTIRAIRMALNDLPDGLDDTYARILMQIPRHHTDVVRRILTWLCFTMVPITPLELRDAIAIDLELDFLDEELQLSGPQDILDMCSSLVVFTIDGTIQLAHASVKDYLLSTSIRDSRVAEFALSPKDAMMDISRCCLAYLSFKEFESGPAKSYEDFHTRLSRYPLLNYAAIAWPNQYLNAEQPPELEERIMKFLRGNHSIFMSWIQVLNALPILGKSFASAWKSFPVRATPLYYASSFGLLKIVRVLIQDGDDLDAPASRFGGTALHGAVVRHHIPVIKLLLEAGADVNKSDDNDISPLHTAIWHEEREIFSLLEQYGAFLAGPPALWLDSDECIPSSTQASTRTGYLQAALPGNENVSRYVTKSDEIKSFNIFA